jgi:hypothetical protein
MANVKITDLTTHTNPASTDVLPIVDVGADITKKVSIADLLENAGSGTASAPGVAFDGDSNTGIFRPGPDELGIATGGTERARFTGGYMRLASGTGGIQFNGDTAAANALDDYEEGTWTPVYIVDTGDPGYTITTSDSVYTKIGRLVCLRLYVVISGYTGASGGNLRVRNIPFAPAGTEFIVGRGGYTTTDTVPDPRTSWTGFDVVSDAQSPRDLYLKGVDATTLINTRAFFTVMYRV